MVRRVYISDTTVANEKGRLSFREKTEICRSLEKLGVDAIELGEIKDEKSDSLFVRTVSSFVKNAVISVAAGSSPRSVELAGEILKGTARPRIRIELSLSVSGMEYIHGKKAPAMLSYIGECVRTARGYVPDVELCALDATRADREFLIEAAKTAVREGAGIVTVCDSATVFMPDDLASLVGEVAAAVPEAVTGVRTEEQGGLASASAVMSVRAGASWVKSSVGGDAMSLSAFAGMLHDTGINYGLSCGIKNTELSRTVKQIGWIADNSENALGVIPVGAEASGEEVHLDVNDTLSSVKDAVVRLGYDLSEEDMLRVYEQFQRVSAHKDVGAKELEAIISTSALQVPETYRLESYVINNGNMMSSSAQISMKRDGETLRGLALAGGPIDAAFLAIEEILGHHYELDDFQIQAVTEGKEAMGSAFIKLRHGGKLYSGNGISTDIIGASIRAYINALNKIAYEEEQ